MPPKESHAESQPVSPIFIVSGGTGASGEQLLRTVLAQFTGVNVPVTIESRVQTIERVEAIVARAAAADGTIVHTLVDADVRRALVERAQARGVTAIDLTGPLLEHLRARLGREPLGQPGRYRQLNEAYFRRIEAIEYAVAHDDGKRLHELAQAEIVLVGVSRVGKTPLSMVLAMEGWKVANVPLVWDVPPPQELLAVERRRVIGLTAAPAQLLIHRRSREQHLGIAGSTYSTRDRVHEEIRAANHFFQRHAFTVVDMTDKPIETSANEVLALLHIESQHFS